MTFDDIRIGLIESGYSHVATSTPLPTPLYRWASDVSGEWTTFSQLSDRSCHVRRPDGTTIKILSPVAIIKQHGRQCGPFPVDLGEEIRGVDGKQIRAITRAVSKMGAEIGYCTLKVIDIDGRLIDETIVII